MRERSKKRNRNRNLNVFVFVFVTIIFFFFIIKEFYNFSIKKVELAVTCFRVAYEHMLPINNIIFFFTITIIFCTNIKKKIIDILVGLLENKFAKMVLITFNGYYN